MKLIIDCGEYFAELKVVNNSNLAESNKSKIEALYFKRIFLQKEPFKQALPEFLKQNQIANLESVEVRGSYFLRPLHLRLGGSVAQIVTEGWENWMDFDGQNPNYKASNPELIFPVSERLSLQGDILKPLDEAQVQSIIDKLQKKISKGLQSILFIVKKILQTV